MEEHPGLLNVLSRFLSPVTHSVPGFLCKNDSSVYIRSLMNGDLWASIMWDSSAKVQSGVLTGNLNSLGNFDECLDVKVNETAGDFKGQYCLTRFDLPNGTANTILGSLYDEVLEEEENIHLGLGDLLSKGLHWGYCIPSSCSATDLAAGLSDHLSRFSMFNNVTISVSDSDCTTNHHDNASLLESFANLMLILWVFLILISTIYNFTTVYRANWYRWGIDEIESSPEPQQAETQTSSSPEQAVGGSPLSVDPPQASPSAGSVAQISPGNGQQNEEREQPSDTTVSPLTSLVREATASEIDLLATFSLFKNGGNLFRMSMKDSTLRSVNGIKTLSLLCVVLGQSYLVTSSLPAINYISNVHIYKKWPVTLMKVILPVEAFIVCSGVLTSFCFLRDMNKREIKKRNRIATICFFAKYFPLFFIHRYIRLTPSILALILVQFSVLGSLGSGPFWKSGNSYINEVCKESWWGTLLYIQNFVNSEKLCLPHSWYAMVDMQLYFLSPLLLLFFVYRKQKDIFSNTLLLIFIVTVASLSLNLGMVDQILSESVEVWQNSMKYNFLLSYTKIPSYVVGMLTGYLLYKYRDAERKERSLTWHLYVVWSVLVLLLGVSMFGLFYFTGNEELDIFFISLFTAMHQMSWAIGIAWIVVISETNHGGIIQKVLTSKIFQPLSRLSYCFYLVHYPLLVRRALETRVPIHVNTVTGLTYFFTDLSSTLHYTVILALFVEMPVMTFFKALSIRCNFTVRTAEVRPGHYAQYLHESPPFLIRVKDMFTRIFLVCGEKQNITPVTPEITTTRSSPVENITSDSSERTDSEHEPLLGERQGSRSAPREDKRTLSRMRKTFNRTFPRYGGTETASEI